MDRFLAPLVCLALVALLGTFLPKEEPPTIDLDVSKGVQGMVGPEVGEALRVTSEILAPPWAAIATIGLSLLVGWRLGRRSGVFVLACLASTQLLVEFTKAVTKRHRPDGALVVGGSMESTHAFPSGHVAFAAAAGAALTIALSRGRPESQGTGFLLTALLTVWVALSRIYLGRHWLTDTIGSVLLAAGMVSLCTIWLGPKTTGPPQGGPPRGAFSSVPPPPPE